MERNVFVDCDTVEIFGWMTIEHADHTKETFHRFLGTIVYEIDEDDYNALKSGKTSKMQELIHSMH